MRELMLATACAALFSTAAAADEVWTTALGDFVYLSESGDTAIFSYPLGDGTEGHLYFPGLAGNFENRGVHDGYWIDPGKGECGPVLRGPDKLQSTAWGRARIIFHSTGFPSAWTLLFANCFAEPANPLIGTPKEAGM